jgi:hypothetical protein
MVVTASFLAKLLLRRLLLVIISLPVWIGRLDVHSEWGLSQRFEHSWSPHQNSDFKLN